MLQTVAVPARAAPREKRRCHAQSAPPVLEQRPGTASGQLPRLQLREERVFGVRFGELSLHAFIIVGVAAATAFEPESEDGQNERDPARDSASDGGDGKFAVMTVVGRCVVNGRGWRWRTRI